jgi:steroid delta-isomerase
MKAVAVLVASCWNAGAAWAQGPGEAEAAIRAALSKWAADFNAHDASRVCDLFAADLRYRGFPERGYDALCDLLHRSLSDRSKDFHYSLEIKEVIVSGDLAIVRLVWTLRVMMAGSSQAVETKEPGLDVFRKQPGGQWKIARYVAYEAP